jgi:hypothetical protein
MVSSGVGQLFAYSHRPKKNLWASCVEGQPISLRDYFSVTWTWPYNLTTALFLSPSNAGVQGLEICRRIFSFLHITQLHLVHQNERQLAWGPNSQLIWTS